MGPAPKLRVCDTTTVNDGTQPSIDQLKRYDFLSVLNTRFDEAKRHGIPLFSQIDLGAR